MMAWRATHEHDTSQSAATRCSSTASVSVRFTEKRSFLAAIRTPRAVIIKVHITPTPLRQVGAACSSLRARRLVKAQVLHMFPSEIEVNPASNYQNHG